MVLTQCDCRAVLWMSMWCEIQNKRGLTTGETMTLMMVATSSLNVKVDHNKRWQTTRVTVTLFKRYRTVGSNEQVSDSDRSTSLSFLSCGALQSDEIIGILKVLFRYVGNGTRWALTSMDWLNTREAVILVPDPIAFAPGQAL